MLTGGVDFEAGTDEATCIPYLSEFHEQVLVAVKHMYGSRARTSTEAVVAPDPTITMVSGRVGFFKPPDPTVPPPPTSEMTAEAKVEEARQAFDAIREVLQRLEQPLSEQDRTKNLAYIQRAVSDGARALKPKKETPKAPALTMKPVEDMLHFVVRPVLVWDPPVFWPHLVSFPLCWKCRSDANVRCDGWAGRSRRVFGVSEPYYVRGRKYH